MSDDNSLKIEYRPSFGTEKLSIQLNEVNSMYAVLNAISSLHDRVNVVYK